MKPLLALVLLAFVLAVPAVAFGAGARDAPAPDTSAVPNADRHPGIYQFRGMRPGECAARQRERQLAPRPVRPQRLGDLPPAYVIRLENVSPSPWVLRGLAQPQFDPCATLERVK